MGIQLAKKCIHDISLYLYIKVTVCVHNCEAPPSHHHPGQSVRRLNTPSKESHTVKTFGLLQPLLWSSQLHACCVRDMLQTSRNASNLIESL